MLEADVFIVKAATVGEALKFVEDNIDTLERDSFEQMDNSDGDPWAIEVPTVRAYHDVQCPKCGRDDELDVFATVYVRLTPEGSDTDQAENVIHSWGAATPVRCHSCDHDGTIFEFRVKS
jgi:ribosomal protein S27E